MKRFVLGACGLVFFASQSVVAQIPQQRSSSSPAGAGAATQQARGPAHAVTAAPPTPRAMRETVNSGLVGLLSGGMDGTDLGEATDLAASLDGSHDHLRVLPVAGKGAFQNVTDIVFARGIDIGIIQSDVLAALKRNPPFPHLENFLQYITKLYDAEVHILAGKDVNSVEDLASKKVNFGMRDSGTDMTANIIFGRLGVIVDETSFSQPVALEKLRRGEISAMVYVVGKPARLFQEIRPDESLHFVPVTTTTDLGGSYTPATLRPEDYPELIEAGRPIATLAVGSVLAAYNWPAGTERYRKVANFVRVFFDRLHDLQAPPHHPKWRDINLVAEVPGWTRFAPAEQWIRKAGLDYGAPPRRADLDEVITQRRAAALSPQERDVIFTEFSDYQRRQHHVTGSAGLQDPRQRDALFREFVDYQERQTREANSAGSLDPRQRDALFREFLDYQKGQTHEANSAGSLDLRQRDSLFAEFVDYSKR